MKGKLLYISLVAVLLFSMLTPTHLQPVSAQVPEPEIKNPFPSESCISGMPCTNNEGLLFMSADEITQTKTLDETKSTGGPDDFGYIWNNSVAYSWIDATSGGTEVGISDRDDIVGPISIPFDFKFYENTYSEMYITGAGYLTFQNSYVNSYFQIPSTTEPNNLIAPLSSGWYYEGNYPAGKVFYKSGGTAPNRYIIVEWHEVKFPDFDPSTFQAILYENGNILFQFKEVNLLKDMGTYYAGYSARSGIEDSQGLDGLVYSDNSFELPSNSAVLFTRPAPSARVRITPLFQGKFTKSNEINEFQFTISNTGELGSDTYDFTLFPGWSPTLHKASNNEPLVDTDMDGIIDTGLLAQGDSLELKLRVVTPDGLTAGASNTVIVTATSSLNFNKSKTARFDLSVPAPFAQIYSGLNNSQVSLDLVWPEIQPSIALTPDWSNGHDPVVAETSDHNFVNIWSDWVYQEGSQGWILKYSIVDKYGNVINPVTNLTNLDNSTDEYRSDGATSIAIAPDGKIGITWEQYLYNYSSGLYNLNIWYAILNPSGTIAYGPINLTNNTTWGNWDTVGFQQVFNPSIAATEDNHFMISWQKHQSTSSSTSLAEIFYSIIQSSGNITLAPTPLASGVAGSLEYSNSSITSLNSNRFFVTYSKRQLSGTYWTYGSFFRVYNSNGGLIKSETEIPDMHNRITSKQLSGGNILLASPEWGSPSTIKYKVLDSSTYNSIYSSSISHPTMVEYSIGLSITIDNSNRGILTWTDQQTQQYLYYALIDGSGPVTTPPSIFHFSEPGEYIGLNYYGGSNTTNSWEPETSMDGLVEFDTNIFGTPPGGSANIGIFYANDGLTTATNAKLTLNLDANVTYQGDTSGITPSVVGSKVEWDLPNLALLDHDDFMVYVSIPNDAPIGTQYAISVTLSSDGVDSNPNNNTSNAIVFSAIQVFLPMIAR
jgi:hypothetical protein